MHEIKLIVKKIWCIKLVNYSDKYTEMHGQQNVKIIEYLLLNIEMSTRQEVWVINVKYPCHKATRTLNVTQESSLADAIVVPSGLKIVPRSLYST